MPMTGKSLRVLIVDDNRDGADALGLLVEELGNQVHVTYGGTQALDVATVFRPDLMLVDLLMPGMYGFDLVKRVREISNLADTTIVAITGLKGEEHKAFARESGCDTVFEKPVALADIKAVLASVVPAVPPASQPSKRAKVGTSLEAERRLPIGEARRIRNERASKCLTQAESEAAISEGIAGFQEEYMACRSELIRTHLINDLLIVRVHGVLTRAERQLAKSLAPDKGRDLIKQTRKQLIELARPMLESLVHEVTGVKVLSMYHDISTLTGEEVIVFSLVQSPSFAAGEAKHRPR